MKLFLIIMSSIFQIAFTKTLSKTDWVLGKSDLMYTVSFPLKTVEGHNREAKGKLHCDKAICEFLVAAEVKKFDSGDSNRDTHMMEVTKASLFTYVTVRGKIPQDILNSKIKVDLEVELAGVKQIFSGVTLSVKENNSEYEVEGDFDISLKQFQIKAPSLLGIEVKDKVPMHITTHWQAS